MRRLLIFIFSILLTLYIMLLAGCATPQLNDTEGKKKYTLSPDQVLTIDSVSQILELDKSAIREIVSLTPDEVDRLVDVLKAIDPFGIRINQDMGEFIIEILVEKEVEEGSHEQTATTETSPETTLSPALY